MSASLGIQSVMTTCAFLPNGGMITEPGPDEVAIGVAGAVDAGPPGLNAGADGELHAATGTTAAQAAAAVTSYSISSVASHASLAGSRPSRNWPRTRVSARSRQPASAAGSDAAAALLACANRARKTCQSTRAPGPRRNRPPSSVTRLG